MALLVKNPPAKQETWVRSLGWEDPLEAGMEAHSSILAWRIPVDSGDWQATENGVTKTQVRLSDSAQHRRGGCGNLTHGQLLRSAGNSLGLGPASQRELGAGCWWWRCPDRICDSKQ